MIIFVIMLPTKLGRMAMNKAQQRNVIIHIMIFLLIAGPTSWLNIFKGLRDNSSLPSGAGSAGEWFGLSLAFPTGFFSAWLFGMRSI